jgi:hypothetical protein
MALVTGATPKLSGVYYDDSYDRTMFAPPAQTASGTRDCSGPAGAEAMYFENVDAGAPTFSNPNGSRPILDNTIDPAQLGRKIVNGACVPVWPNDFLRTNSIFTVAHEAGLRTAWADKHPAANQGVAGHGTPNSVDDPFMTEINADIIPATPVDTRGRTITFPHPNPAADPNGPFITDSVGNTEAYDQIKVDAILNEIDGQTSAGTGHPGAPAIFGMNFQAVSVGQKLIDPWLSCVRSGNAPGCDPSYFPRRLRAGKPCLHAAACRGDRVRRRGPRLDGQRAPQPGAPRIDRADHHGQARAVADRPFPAGQDRSQGSRRVDGRGRESCIRRRR